MPPEAAISPVQACLNGARAPGAHPRLPLTPEELASQARAAVQAGARSLHVHPRDPAGRESLEPAHCAAALQALRAACPGIPVGLSTGLWMVGDPRQRHRLVAAWEVLPDFVSINFAEPGWLELCRLAGEMGFGVEAGLASAEDARRLAEADGLPLVRLLLEPKEQDLEAAHAAVDAMLTVLEPLHPTLPRLLHGLDHTTWPLLERSLALGYEVRIGLEDTLTLPDGNPAPDNAALVEYTVQRAQEAGSRKP